MSKSKAIGTAVETAIRKYVAANGFPDARRIALAGQDDQGDVALNNHVIIEAKGGKAAEKASPGQIVKWLEDTERERVNAGAHVGILVCKRAGVGHARAGEWSAYLSVTTLMFLLATPSHNLVSVDNFEDNFRVTLSAALKLVKSAGYGSD